MSFSDQGRYPMLVDFDTQFLRLQVEPPRFITYVDGYNFYAAINYPDPPDLLRLGWCNFAKLGQTLVARSFELPADINPRIEVRYFTARVDERTSHKGEKKRQDLWLDTLLKETGIEPILGLHMPRPGQAGREEKKTDVNIALRMVRDLSEGRPQGMILISGDLDLQPAVEAVASKGIPIAVFCPHSHPMYQPEVGKDHSKNIRTSYLTRTILTDCRLSDQKGWREYLRLKVESTTPTQPKGAKSPFRACFDYEDRIAIHSPSSTSGR